MVTAENLQAVKAHGVGDEDTEDTEEPEEPLI